MEVTASGPLRPEGGFLRLHRGGEQIGAASCRAADDTVHLCVVPLHRVIEGRADVVACLGAAIAAARRNTDAAVTLHSDDPLVRDAARSAGLAGDLRRPLTLAADADLAPPVAPPGPITAEQLAGLLGGFGVAVEPMAARGAVGRALNRGRTGVGRTADVRLVVADVDPVRLSVPATDGVLIEQVARVASTAMELMARFGPWWILSEIAFDRSSSGLHTGAHAGEYRSVGSRIALSSTAAVWDDRLRVYRKRSRQPVPFDAPATMPGARVMRIDRTLVHEVGHLVWDVFRGRQRQAHDAIDVALGTALGVRRMADVLDGVRPDAPEHRRAAAARFRAEVSDYALTNLGEAMAELFTVAVTDRDPSPIVKTFADLLGEHLPRPAPDDHLSD